MDDDNLCVLFGRYASLTRMIDMSSLLGQQNTPICFVSGSALESQLSCCQESQRAMGEVDVI